MKTLLLPKILADQKRGEGCVKPPMLLFSTDAPTPPLLVLQQKKS